MDKEQQLSRRRSFRAAVLGLTIAIGAAWLGFNVIRSTSSVPADDTDPPKPALTVEPTPVASIEWESLPGVSIDEDAIVGIRRGDVTQLPASIAAFREATGYAVAPDGDLVLFQAREGGSSVKSCWKGDCQIFVANVDGSGLRQLTDAPGFGAIAAGWSPDGSTIVAVLDGAAGRGDVDLVLIDVATGETTPIANGRADDFYEPHFDFGGQRILVSRYQKYRDLEGPYPQDEGTNVYAIPVAGGDATLVFENRWNATFSPDGRTIVYEKSVVVGNMGGREIWLADADGSHARPLVPNDGPFGDTPSWSPDGTRIVFTKHPGDGSVVAIVDVAGGAPTFAVRTPSTPVGVWLDDHTLLIDVT